MLHGDLFSDAFQVLFTYQTCRAWKDGREHLHHLSPTSGIVVVLWALQLCDSVSVYGMGFPPLTQATPYQVEINHKP